MGATSPEPVAADVVPRPRRGTIAVCSAALALIAAAVPLAAPGPGLVPGAAPDDPAWILGLYGDGLGVSPGFYLGALYGSIAAWVGVWLGASRLGLRAVAGMVAATVLAFALAPPLLSLDVFSYISYGRLGTEAGLNPYEFAPADIPADEAAQRVDDFRSTPSVYGPLFTALCYPLAAVGPSFALWALKALAAASVGALAWLTALNPLVLVHVVGGAHNDGLMAAVGIAGVVAVVAGRALAGAAGLVGAISIKASGGLYAPFALLGARQQLRGRLWFAFAALAVALVGAGLALFGGAITEALSVASDNQRTVSRWSVPATASRISGIDVDLLRPLLALAYGLVLVGLLAWVFRGADWIRAAGWAGLGLLVATSWMVPWYLVWVLPLAAVSRDRALAAGVIAMSVFQAVNSIPL